MSIPGTVHCPDDDREMPDGNLAGSWCLSPTSPMAYHQMMADSTDTSADESLLHESETLYRPVIIGCLRVCSTTTATC